MYPVAACRSKLIRTPVVAGGDPYFANVVLLAHMNGTDASTTFIDSSSYGRTITALGDAQIDTAQSKFGGASGLFDGTADYLSTADANELSLIGDWTIEAWVRIASATGQKTIVAKWENATQEFILEINGATPRFWWAPNSVGAPFLTSSSTISTSTWYYLSVTRSGNNFELRIDGVSKATGTLATGGFNRAEPLRIGAWGNGSTPIGTWPMNGWIDDLRITVGTARNVSTPPATQFPDS